MVSGRSPHGERGLKLRHRRHLHSFDGSLPTRGAWIEIVVTDNQSRMEGRRSPHGERGLKSLWNGWISFPTGVAPHTGSVD